VKSIAYKILLCVIFSITLPYSVLANTPKVFIEAPENWIEPVSVSSRSADAIEGSVHYILFDNQIDIRGESKTNFFRYVLQPVNEQGLTSISQVEVMFSPQYEHLTFHTINVTRNGEVINKLDISKVKIFQQEEQLKDNLYSENWIALFILEDIRVGDTIDYSYSIKGTNPVLGTKYFGSSPLSWSVPIRMTNFRLISNSKEPLNIKIHNSDKKITKKVASETIEYSFFQKEVSAIREDDDSPSWFNPYTYLTYSQYESWEDVNSWALELYDNDFKLPSELIDIIEQNKGKSKIESATKTIQWIQDNIRYFGVEMGINSHKPSTPLETFERRYGDCKDKALLLIAALKYFNIQAYPVLVSTTTSKRLPELIPSPGAFNHVIITFNFDNKDYWVDGTVSNQRGSLDQISFPNLYWGLVVKKGEHELHPILPSNDNQLGAKVNVEQNIIINNEGKHELYVDTKYTGWKAEQFRSYMKKAGVKASSNDHLDYFSKYYKKIEEKNKLIINDSSTSNALLIKESYYLDESLENTNDKILVYANPILDNIWLPNVRQRQSPFVLPQFLDINLEIKVTTNEEDDVVWFDNSTFDVENNKWFTYSRNSSKNGNTLIINYKYKSLLSEVSSDEFDLYSNLLNSIEDSLTFPIVLKNKKTAINRNVRAKNLVKMLMNADK
jgi:hypothetical protein